MRTVSDGRVTYPARFGIVGADDVVTIRQFPCSLKPARCELAVVANNDHPIGLRCSDTPVDVLGVGEPFDAFDHLERAAGLERLGEPFTVGLAYQWHDDVAAVHQHLVGLWWLRLKACQDRLPIGVEHGVCVVLGGEQCRAH